MISWQSPTILFNDYQTVCGRRSLAAIILLVAFVAGDTLSIARELSKCPTPNKSEPENDREPAAKIASRRNPTGTRTLENALPLAEDPDESPIEEFSANDFFGEESEFDLPEGVRNQFLQAALLETTYLPAGVGDDFGVVNINTEVSVGLPGPISQSMWLISPGFEVKNLQGPASIDLPAQLFRASTRFQFRGLATERLAYEISASPGVYSDFQTGAGEVIRTPGHAGVRYQLDEQRYLILGVLYLDRQDIDFLPVGGVIFKSHDNLIVEAFFPRPRVAWKTSLLNGLLPHRDHWLYFTMDFGGGSWAVRRTDGRVDTLTLRDYRLVFGYEALVEEGIDFRAEVGYVLGRSVELSGAGASLTPNDTVLLRCGLAY